MSNVITLNQLNDSKMYVKNNMTFMHPKSIVEPFLEAIKYSELDGLEVKVQNEVVNDNQDGTSNIAYPRFAVEVSRTLAGPIGETYTNVFGILTAMDPGKPVVKAYSGFNAKACTNLTLFNAEHSYSQDLLQDFVNLWKTVREYHFENEEKIETYSAIHNRLINELLDNEAVNNILGYAIRNAQKEGLGVNPVVNAARLLDNRKSIYYFEKETSLFNVFSAITQGITDSPEIITRPDKTIAAAKILGILN